MQFVYSGLANTGPKNQRDWENSYGELCNSMTKIGEIKEYKKVEIFNNNVLVDEWIVKLLKCNGHNVFKEIMCI